MLAAAFVYAGDRVPRYYRFALSWPLGLGIGFHLSASQGVCGMSFTQEWDPDGRGIRRIADPAFAKAMWNKAIKTHIAQAVLPMLATAAFIVAPF